MMTEIVPLLKVFEAIVMDCGVPALSHLAVAADTLASVWRKATRNVEPAGTVIVVKVPFVDPDANSLN